MLNEYYAGGEGREFIILGKPWGSTKFSILCSYATSKTTLSIFRRRIIC